MFLNVGYRSFPKLYVVIKMSDDQKWTKEKIKSRIEENELDLSLCSISKVPVKILLQFPKVTILDLSCNKINVLPETFTRMIHLIQLDLNKNSITELPYDFGNLVMLKKLDLLNNNIEELPLTFSKLKNLLWLDMKGNPIQERYPKVVGDCLKPSECQLCAKNVVQYYGALQSAKEADERKAEKRKQDRLLKQQKEDERLRQRRREERKNRQKKVEGDSKNSHIIEDTTPKNENAIEEAPSTAPSSYKRLIIGLLLFAIAFGFIFIFNADFNLAFKSLTELLDQCRQYIKRKSSADSL